MLTDSILQDIINETKEIYKLYNAYNRPLLEYENFGYDRILITVGDSWTWGDSLDNTKKTYTSPNRKKMMYGYHLSKSLKCNWLNVAIPGCGNGDIFNLCVYTYYTILKHKFDLYLFLCLTDIGRDITASIDYRQNILTSAEKAEQYSINFFLKKIKNKIDPSIHKKVFFGKNFCDFFPATKNKFKNIVCDLTWLDIIIKHTKKGLIEEKNELVHFVHDFDRVGVFCKKNIDNMKIWLDDIQPKMLKVRQILLDSDLTSNRATNHPNEKGHKLYAQYLQGEMLKKGFISV